MVFISPESNKSEYVQAEFKKAINEHKPIIPIILEKTELNATFSLHLTQYKYIERWNSDIENYNAKIRKSLELYKIQDRNSVKGYLKQVNISYKN